MPAMRSTASKARSTAKQPRLPRSSTSRASTIDEAEFVDPASYRSHYETTARRIAARLEEGVAAGDLRAEVGELHAWALMGMNVFLGLRYAIWGEEGEAETIAAAANEMVARGIARPAS